MNVTTNYSLGAVSVTTNNANLNFNIFYKKLPNPLGCSNFCRKEFLKKLFSFQSPPPTRMATKQSSEDKENVTLENIMKIQQLVPGSFEQSPHEVLVPRGWGGQETGLQAA